MRRTQRFPRYGYQITPSPGVRAVKLSSGWGDGSITVDAAGKYFAATVVSTLRRFQTRASWSRYGYADLAFKITTPELEKNVNVF